MGIDTVQLNNSDPMRESQNGMPEKRQIRLDKRKEQSRSSRANETEEQRQIRLEKQKKRDQSSMAIETDEERQIRLKKLKERSQSSRTNETEEQRQIRLKKRKERSGSRRTNETIEQRQIRLKELKERSQSSRTNETVEQRQIRLDKQRKRSQADRAKKKLEKRSSNKSGVQQQDIEMQFAETDDHASLPLKLDDLCDTLKVIFVGARPSERIHLKKVLTVRKKKIIQALHWLKKYNVLYQNVTINLENIAELPEDDVPECIMSTLEQKLGDEKIQSERVGYVPDPLSNPIEHTTADTIPISNSNILKTMIVDGVLSPIKAYFGTVESQGRGSLHLHMLIWLDHDLKPADMKEKIQNADFREKLKAYLEDIIKEDLDDFKDKQVFENLNVPRSFDTPPRLSQDNIYAALRTIDLTGLAENINKSPVWSTPIKQQLSPSIPYASPLLNKSLQTPTHDRPTSIMNVLHNQSNINPACLPTPNPSSPNFATRFRADVVQLVETDNKHKHTDTCYKYSNPKQGDKKICRLRMPRKLVPVSTIDPDTGHISVRRSDPWINNFNEYLIAACRSNMDIKFIWSGSDAKALVYYITDYNAGSVKENINQKGRPPSERYLFQNQHPQATTYLMRKYSQSHVPILYGPQIPRQDREDTRERYNRALLTLFVPWRTVADLCDVNETWEDAFKSRKNFVSMHSWQIIENIQLLHECKKDRDEHLLQVIAEAQVDTDSIDPVLLPANQDIHGEYDMDDSDDLLELLGNLDDLTAVAANATKRSTENKYIEEAIEAVENVGRFTHVNTHGQRISSESTDQIGQQLLPFVSATPNFVRLNLKYQEQLKTEKERIRRSLITGNYDKTDDTLDYDDAQDAIVTLIDPNNYNKNNIENCGSIHPVISFSTSFPTQKSIAHEFTLNREQRAAFMIITSHLDGDSGRRTDNNNGQLIMCIPGCGGTGKSQLIRAVTKYFLVTKRMQILRKLAPTGIAAAEIGGMTIHSFLGEQRNSRKPRTIKPGDLKLEKEWKLIKYLLIDEMSMVGLTLLAKLNRIICVAKCLDPQVPFGGVNVIFFGDYLQYRPVYDVPLHTDFSLPSKKKSGKLPNENEIQQRVARSLILQINCVVKLTQQMRTEDLRYLQLLERLRHGQCNHDDYELLLARVVGQPSTPSLHDSPWNKAPILVFRNEVRTQLNHKAAIHNAAQLGSTPMVCVAQDTCKGKTIEDPTLIKKLLKLSDSKTEHLPGLLPFVPGMPVILTQNIATELGLINGINGIFRQLVYQADSVSTDVLSDSFPKNTQYVRQPLYALIEIAKSKIECNLEELQPTLVPIPLMEQTFRADIADILPKDKKSKSNQKAILSIKRRALPLVPAYCITTHKSQGQTLNKVVVDLKLPNESDDIAAVYVPLSRVKRLTDLIVLRHFDYKVLLIKPSKSQLAEMQRLDKLYIGTQTRFSEWFQ
ncbi:unnamed protein product [Rotaria sordida]|uniref:ATP-dependent DNA helicase n=1 Tax=Rotaria sordida TaxID=392033 RepID=A0A815BMZ6_9BILA|nr:unnamed protein product [Rotaria sordida]CAF1551953.1 unnamed protein product [Rotaria sordida]